MDDVRQDRQQADPDLDQHEEIRDPDGQDDFRELEEGLERADTNNIVDENTLEGGSGRPKIRAPDGGWGWFVVVGTFLVHVLLGGMERSHGVIYMQLMDRRDGTFPWCYMYTNLQLLEMFGLSATLTSWVLSLGPLGGMERSHGVIYLQLLDRFGLSATLTSWVLSLCTSALFLVGPVMGALNRKFSCRAVEGLGTTLSVAGVLVSGFAPNLPFLYFSYSLLAGVGRGLSYGTSLISLGQYFEKRLGLAVGLATSGTGVGTFFMPPLAELLFVEYGFRGAFLIMSAIVSHCFVCALLFRPRFAADKLTNDDTGKTTKQNAFTDLIDSDQTKANTQPESKSSGVKSIRDTEERHRKHEHKDDTNGNEEDTKPRKPILQLYLLKNYAFTATCVQIFFHTVAQQCTIVFLPALAKTRGLTPVQGALLISVIGIFDAVSKVVLSTVLDLKRVKPYRLIIYNILVFLIGIVAATYPSMRNMWQFALVSAMYGVFSGAFVSQKSVVIVDILGTDKLSGTLGLLLLFQGAGSLVGPTIGAMYQDVFGGYEMAFYLGAVGLFTGGVINTTGNVWLYLHRKRRQS